MVAGFEERLQSKLLTLRAGPGYRVRCIRQSPLGAEVQIEGRCYLDFSSNDYLGLAGHPKVREGLERGIARYGVGSGGSHLVGGHCSAHAQLEEELATFVRRPRALLFSTGYMANLGLVTALAGRGDTVLEDRANHASLIDAALLSRARLQRYRHGDLESLEALLSTLPPVALVASDAVFSMDGDLALLPGIAALCKRYGAVPVVDDAHGLGVLGPEGRGTVQHFGLGLDDVPVLMATLGKALGVFGAFVAGSDALIETLIQRARSYIYTTAMPPALAVALRAALSLTLAEGWRRELLGTLIEYFRAGASTLAIPVMDSRTPIQPVLIGSSAEAMRAAEQLRCKGIYAVAIRPPTVPKGSARLRIGLTAAHTHAHLDRLLEALATLRLTGQDRAR